MMSEKKGEGNVRELRLGLLMWKMQDRLDREACWMQPLRCHQEKGEAGEECSTQQLKWGADTMHSSKCFIVYTGSKVAEELKPRKMSFMDWDSWVWAWKTDQSDICWSEWRVEWYTMRKVLTCTHSTQARSPAPHVIPLSPSGVVPERSQE